MDPNAASVSDLVFSLEAMIQSSITAVLDRRLGPAADTLDVQIQAAVAAALDRRLSPSIGSLGNRMTSLIEQRLGNAVSTLDHRINTSVTAALEQRLGPAGSALTAQVIFTAAPVPVLPSVAPPKAQLLGPVKGTNETNVDCAAEEELKKAQSIENRATSEKERPMNQQDQGIGGSPDKEGPAQERSLDNHFLGIGPTEKGQLARKQNASEPETSKTAPLDSGDDLAVPAAMVEKSNESTSKETAATHSNASERPVYPIFADGISESKAGTHVFFTAKPNAKTTESSSSASKTPAKRKANYENETNKADGAGESESSSSDEESDNEKPKRKRGKFKLDPPGYTEGPPIKFRRISPKLTARAKCRGYPRVVDIKSFSEASNKRYFTMADVVATVLFNYDPLSLYAFMDMDQYPTFNFIRKERDCSVRNFVIERRSESQGVVVKVCGPQLMVARTALTQ